MSVLITIAVALLALGPLLWIGYTKLSDWAYDGPWPENDHRNQIGATIRDENGKLWIYSTDMVASCFWKPGHLWAHIRERHNHAVDVASGVVL